jgi:serine/threonine protein kinase
MSSDMYSLGVLIYALFNKGKTPYNCDNSMAAFKRNVEMVCTNCQLNYMFKYQILYQNYNLLHGYDFYCVFLINYP